MGFRSKVMAEDWGLDAPKWFLEKYADTFHFLEYEGSRCISFASKTARKYYSALEEEEQFKDIQRVLIEAGVDRTLHVVMLHECGGITLVFITKESITAREPREWKSVSFVEHSDNCYGCSGEKD